MFKRDRINGGFVEPLSREEYLKEETKYLQASIDMEAELEGIKYQQEVRERYEAKLGTNVTIPDGDYRGLKGVIVGFAYLRFDDRYHSYSYTPLQPEEVCPHAYSIALKIRIELKGNLHFTYIAEDKLD